ASPKTAHIHDTSKPRRSAKNYAEKYADRPKQTSERTRARCVIASKSLFQNANASEPLQNQARKQREVAKQGIEERKKARGNSVWERQQPPVRGTARVVDNQ
ncbi:hypothetical protein IscW_ISCW014926, partial [Ixodes scapularis]